MRRRDKPEPILAADERPCGFAWKTDEDGSLYSGGCACGRPRYEHPGFSELWARMRAEDAGVDVMRNQLDRAMTERIQIRRRMPMQSGQLLPLQNGHRRALVDGVVIDLDEDDPEN